MTRRKSRKPSESEVLAVLGVAIFVGGSMSGGFGAALVSVALLLLLFILVVYGYQHSWWQRGMLTPFKVSKPIRVVATVEGVEAMSGIEFERFVGEMFKLQGYKVEYTSVSADYGVDLVLEKDRIRTAVQVKHYKRPLSQAPVREVVAGMLVYKCSKAMVITNSTFTKSARHLAKSNYVKLVDRDALWQLISQVDNYAKPQEFSQKPFKASREITIGEFLKRWY